MTTEQIISIPIANLRPSPTNPRKHGLTKGLDEMAGSIKSVGVLQPIVAREYSGLGDETHEVVFGHRRRLAAIKAGLEEVPCVVRGYSDDQVLEAQTVENLQREDVHPLDEADGFQVLMKRGGYDVPKIAAKIGKPNAYVVQRLKLCALSAKCRKGYDDERILLGVALELAKLPTHMLQDEAFDHVAIRTETSNGQGMYRAIGEGFTTVADARREIETEIMRVLKGAPFDQADAALVPKAGACTNCPKRTGVQTDLFADASSPDLCTDPSCFTDKVDVAFQLRVKKHKDAGGEVMTAKDSKVFFGGGYTAADHKMRQAYKKLDDRDYIAGKMKSVRQVFGKELPPLILAKDPETGMPVELVAAKDYETAKRKGHKGEPTASGRSGGSIAAEKRRAAEQRRAAEIRREVARALAENAEQFFEDHLVEKAMAEILVQAAAESLWADTLKGAADRRDMPEAPKAKGGGAWRNPNVARVTLWAKEQPANVLLALLLELLVSRDERNDGETAQKRALKLLGVDAKKIAAKVTATAKEKKTAKGRKVVSAKAAKNPGKVGKLLRAAAGEPRELDEDDPVPKERKAKGPGKRPPAKDPMHLWAPSAPGNTACGTVGVVRKNIVSALDAVTCGDCLVQDKIAKGTLTKKKGGRK